MKKKCLWAVIIGLFAIALFATYCPAPTMSAGSGGSGDMTKATYDADSSGKVDAAEDLALTSQAAGDVAYFDGSNWVRLGKDEGKYLKSGAAAVSWDTPAGGAALDYKFGAGALASTNQASGGVYLSDRISTDTAASLTTAFLTPSYYDPAGAVTIKLQQIGNPTMTCNDFSTNLVAFWKLEDTAWLDSTTNNNDLTAPDTPAIVAGYYGNGADFEASDKNYIQITDAAQTGLDLGIDTASFSACAWIKPESHAAVGGIVGKKDEPNNGWRFHLLPDGNIVFALRSGPTGPYLDIFSSTVLNDDEWYHVAVVFDNANDTATIYINGVSDATDTYAYALPNNAEPVFIGAFAATSNNFDGIIDEVGIWNKALSPAEIASVYRSGIEGQFGFADLATVTPGTAATFDAASPAGVRVKITGSASLDVRGFNLMLK